MSLQAIREKKNALSQQANELMNKKDWVETSDGPAYDVLLSQIEDSNTQIKRIEAHNALVAEEAVVRSVSGRAEQRGRDEKNPALSMYAKWLRGGAQNMTPEELQTIRNTLSTTTGSEGGFTVQSVVAKTLIEALKDYSGIREVATVLSEQRGNDISFPTTDGTTELGEILAENTAASAADPVFGTIGIKVYKYGSKVVAIPMELLQDSEIDIEAFIVLRLAERLGRITNQHFTIGTGTNQPRGLITGASAGKVGATGQTVLITDNDLVDLQHSVNIAYRKSQKCAFMMADSSVRVIRKMKDAEGRPIFAPGYDSGAGGLYPDRLLGDVLNVNDDVAAMAANAKSVIYGDMSKYIIRDVMDVTTFRFADSKYIEKGQVGFLAWMRSGGNLTDAGAVKYYQNSAT